MDDMTANTMGSGIPSMVNFEDQTLTNSKSDIGLASKVDPPIGAGSGVFSQPSSVAATGEEPTTPSANTNTDDSVSNNNGEASGDTDSNES